MVDLKHTPCDCAEWRRLNDACVDMMAENADLKATVAILKNRCENQDTLVIPVFEDRLSELRSDLLLLMQDRDALRELLDTTQTAAELLAKDAVRYRWLRDNASGKGYLLNVWQGYELDDAIDAAIQEAQADA